MAELLNKAGIRKRIKSRGMSTSLKSFDALEDVLEDVIARACRRATENKRKTVLSQDI